MLPPEVAKRIWDAVEACKRIQEFTQEMDYSQFAESALVRSAVERQLEIVGEALNKAVVSDASLAYSVPEIPRIVGLRNRLIHGYDAVDDQLVWDISKVKIPSLLKALEALF